MNKPQMKSTVCIDKVFDTENTVNVFAPTELHEEIKAFGSTTTFSTIPDLLQVRVDPRYDFNEVLDYIRSLNQEVAA